MARVFPSTGKIDRSNVETVEMNVIVTAAGLYCPMCWYSDKGLFSQENPYSTYYVTASRWPAFCKEGKVCCKVCGRAAK